ncbi:restriction endonuclease subunit S [Aeromonas hydrophila]|uniref:restriction endonuclease subunit S n=1 Tax=Aeromonas hydrophila TaxID=644 RepID=UPI003F79E1FE
MAEQMIQDKASEMAAKQTIPAGYKQTEVGLIPDDWHIYSLHELANFGGGTTPPRAQYEKYYQCGVHPWVKTLDLNNSVISITDECVTDIALQETSLKLHDIGSVLVAMYGGFNQIGRTGLLNANAAINQALVAIIPKKEALDSEYLLHNLNFYVDYWKGIASSSRKDPNITSNDVKEFKLPVPTVEEQKAIATAVSDFDALIVSLEQLITKKQAIKTATMQQLLTGRTRLPQFALQPDGTPKGYKSSELGQIPEDWEVFCIGDECHTYSGGTPSTSNKDYYGGSIRWITSSDLNKGQIFEVEGRITDLGLQFSSAKEIKAGSFLIALYGATAGVCAISHVDAAINQAVLAVVPRECSSKYLFYWFSMNKNKIIEVYTQGGQPNLSGDIIRSVALPFPLKEEQTAIATILSDMDNELQALTQKLEKARALKQGMMQQLLTGRIRLPLEVGA